MKKLIFICLLIPHFVAFSQNNNGYIVEYNLPILVEYQVYETPLRINKVESQSEINYSTIQGLLQSYLSANNIDWAKSEYIDKNEKITRDNEHFAAVKKSSVNDYIQLETAYIFTYQNRQYAFVKYSLVFEKLPFPWTSLMILENKDNHWYISKLINQNQILFLLGNLNNSFLIDCFQGLSTNVEVSKIIDDSKLNNQLSIRRLSLQVNKFDDKFKNEFYDVRIVNDKAEFRNATVNSELKRYTFNILQPFLINQFTISDYDQSEKGLIKNDVTISKYKQLPELILLEIDTPIDLISKINIDDSVKKYCIIKYKKNNQILTEIIDQTSNEYKIVRDTPFDSFAKQLSIYKIDLIRNLIGNIKEIYKSGDEGVNINELVLYLEENKQTLTKYLDK